MSLRLSRLTSSWRVARAPHTLRAIDLLPCSGASETARYDLVVVDAPLLPFWHPRSFLTALRNWHVQSLSALFAIAATRYMHHFHDVPVAVFDNNDSLGIGAHNFGLVDRSHSYFKRELAADRWQVFFKSPLDLPGRAWRSQSSSQRRLAKLRPLSLGCFPTGFVETVEKTTDIFFAGDTYPSSTVRTDGIKELLALSDEGVRVDIPEVRMDRMTSCGGPWPAPGSPGHPPATAGTASATTRRPRSAQCRSSTTRRFIATRPFATANIAFSIRSSRANSAAAVRGALADKEKLARIAARAKAHMSAHHTFRARAEHVAVTVLGRRLDGSSAALQSFGIEL